MNNVRYTLASPRWLPAVALLLLAICGDVLAQFASTLRLTTPNGRSVLEIRKGTQPANSRLLFTAVITAGPISGSTSLLLQQSLVDDIFNPGAPAAGWTVVRSSITAFSLGGGCGRNNLIDFPFINNNRPEILRITGTTQQVITLGIAGNDQYDSIDCLVQADGRLLYMLTNRTRQRLEFRREQGGLLQLVRDNFGTVITPFVGGMRPSFARFRRWVAGPSAPTILGAPTPDGTAVLQDSFVVFFLEGIVPAMQLVKILAVLDDESLTTRSQCVGASAAAPTGFTIPKESAVADGRAIGPSRNNNVLWGDYFYMAGEGGCTQTEPAESQGSTGPFGLYTWAGVAANNVGGNSIDGDGSGLIARTTVTLPNNVITFEGNLRHTQSSPFANRGGPVTTCPLVGSEIDAAQLAIGVGPSNVHVQHSIISTNLADSIFGGSLENVWDSILRCE